MLPLPSHALIDRYGKPGPRYTSYPAATEWSAAFGPDDASARLAEADRPGEPLSIYVHLPFCEEMCRFCGCNVIATKDRSRADDYLDVLEREVALWARYLPRRRTMSQLHLGGGTPTFLTEAQLERLYRILTATFQPTSGAELAIEVDPAVTRPEQLQLLGRLGFNRISVGVQDLNPQVQQAVNRIQTAEQTERVIQAARAAGFNGVNIDLIYGLPHQTPETFATTIDRVLLMKPDRLALFGYAHVPWMKPQQRLLPEAYLPNTYQRVELLVSAARKLEAAGFRQIGLDHFAREDDELAIAQREGTLSRNFQGYTARTAPDTLAFGVSAISDIGGAFIQSAHKLHEWRAAIDAGVLPVERGRARTREDELRGAAIRMLMCLLKLDIAPLAQQFGPLAQWMFLRARPELEALAADGFLTLRTDGLDVTPLGRLFLRNIAMVFDAYLPEAQPARQAFSKTV